MRKKKDLVFVVQQKTFDYSALPKLEDFIEIKVFVDGGEKLGTYSLRALKKKFYGGD